jgi:hypothetical protein
VPSRLHFSKVCRLDRTGQSSIQSGNSARRLSVSAGSILAYFPTFLKWSIADPYVCTVRGGGTFNSSVFQRGPSLTLCVTFLQSGRGCIQPHLGS